MFGRCEPDIPVQIRALSLRGHWCSDARRNTLDYSAIVYVAGHDGAGSNDAVISDADAWQNHRLRPDIAARSDSDIPEDPCAGRHGREIADGGVVMELRAAVQLHHRPQSRIAPDKNAALHDRSIAQ